MSISSKDVSIMHGVPKDVWEELSSLPNGESLLSSFSSKKFKKPKPSPALIVVDVAGEQQTRWIGERLPKGAVPLGIVDRSGRFMVNLGVKATPSSIAAQKLVTGKMSKKTQLTAGVSVWMTPEEVISKAVTDLNRLADFAYVRNLPEWVRNISSIALETGKPFMSLFKNESLLTRDFSTRDSWTVFEVLSYLVLKAEDVDKNDLRAVFSSPEASLHPQTASFLKQMWMALLRTTPATSSFISLFIFAASD